MFEKPTSFSGIKGDRFDQSAAFPATLDAVDDDPAFGDVQGPLRNIEWAELTARLLAARDFRQVLRRDCERTIGDSAHDFADAAARYLRTKEEGQSNLNPVALEHRKGSPGSIPEHKGLHETVTKSPGLLNKGDARDD